MFDALKNRFREKNSSETTEKTADIDTPNKIDFGEIQEKDLSKNIKLLYIRDTNPVALIYDWCEKNNYEWLSLPDAVEKVGIIKLLDIAPKYFDTHIQINNGIEEIIVSELKFNSYIITKLARKYDSNGLESPAPYIRLGHKLPLSHNEIKEGFMNACPYRITDESRFKNLIDISDRFNLAGWMEDQPIYIDITDESKTTVGDKTITNIDKARPLFSRKYVDLKPIISNKIGDVTPELTCIPPQTQTKLCTISLDNRMKLHAVSFYHTTNTRNNFATYVIVEKKY